MGSWEDVVHEIKIDKLREESACAMCGCLLESWKDFSCEVCRLEYQDAFRN